MYGELTAPSRTTLPTRSSPPISATCSACTATGADVGLAFDGDADRVFFVDETGRGSSGSTTTAILAAGILAEPGATILHNLICSRAVPEVIRERGGTPIRTRVGHSYIKQVMAETGAAFGGEHSAHYYFRDNYRADSGDHRHDGAARAALAGGRLRSPNCASPSSDTPTRGDQHAGRRSARRHRARRRRLRSFGQDHLDGLTVDCGPGGSTFARPTPSRSCASTSKPRLPSATSGSPRRSR